MNWRNRVVEYVEVPPEDLLANPRNAHIHLPRQREVMRALLGELGWVAPVIENVTTGHIVDGHMRVEEALSAGVSCIPVLRVEISEAEEAEVLLTFDGVGQLARWEQDRLTELVADLATDCVVVDELVQDLTGYTPTELPDLPETPDDEITPEFRSLCAVYPIEQYRDVVDGLSRVPGDSVGQKLSWLLSRHESRIH